MGNSLFDDMMSGAIVAKALFKGASKAISKTVEFAESEKGQQLKAELRAKTSEAVEFASDKAREMGLEDKAKSILKYADGDKVREYATPRQSVALTDGQKSRIRAALAAGVASSTLAAQYNVSVSTINRYREGKE